MSNKILVTYASLAGSTVGVAEAIGKTLATNTGEEVDVLPMETIDNLSAYSAVIAGSAIRMDNWLPEAMQFVKQHQQELSQKSFAVFVVCLAMAVKNERRLAKAKVTATGYMQPVRELVPTTISEGLFAGVLDLSKLPMRYRVPFRVATLTGLFKEGDYRDWNAIHEWADDLATKIG
ncbi:MAG: flavodoxin domain-containing protein [Aggregatilineales bacterium]